MDLLKSQNFQQEVSLKKITHPFDAILYYATLVLAFIAATTVAVQFSKDGVSCFAVKCPSQDNATDMVNGTCEILNKPQLTAFLNSECQKSLHFYESYIAFILLAESFAIICVYNLCAVIDPRCSNTLQQFVRIAGECSDIVGTPQQISFVLTSIREMEECTVPSDEHTPLLSQTETTDSRADSPDEISPSINNSSEIGATLDEASKSRIKTVYYKVKTFGDIQKSATHLRNYYCARITFLYALPAFFGVAYGVATVEFNNTIRSSFKCILDNQDEQLAIAKAAYDQIVCSRSLSSFLRDTSLLFHYMLVIAPLFTSLFIIPLLNHLRISFRVSIWPHRFRGTFLMLNDLKVLLLLLQLYSRYEFERFILFYSKGTIGRSPSSLYTTEQNRLDLITRIS